MPPALWKRDSNTDVFLVKFAKFLNTKSFKDLIVQFQLFLLLSLIFLFYLKKPLHEP